METGTWTLYISGSKLLFSSHSISISLAEDDYGGGGGGDGSGDGVMVIRTPSSVTTTNKKNSKEIIQNIIHETYCINKTKYKVTTTFSRDESYRRDTSEKTLHGRATSLEA